MIEEDRRPTDRPACLPAWLLACLPSRPTAGLTPDPRRNERFSVLRRSSSEVVTIFRLLAPESVLSTNDFYVDIFFFSHSTRQKS